MARPTLKPQTELAQRLCAVRQALDFKERKQFATYLGIHEKTLGNYETGKHEPTASALVLYDSICDVSLSWLLTGEGEMFSDPAIAAKLAPPIDPELLERLSKIIETVVKEHHYKLAPSQIACEAAGLYNDLITRVTDITDTEEVEIIIAQLRHLYKRNLAKSAPENSPSNVA